MEKEAKKKTKNKIITEKEQTRKKFGMGEFLVAACDLSIQLDNPYFKTPYNRCPDCNKGNNSALVYFGVAGKNKIGNLKKFNATVGDLISWNSDTYKGLSVIKSKENGVYELETSPFDTPRMEPAVVERMVIPTKYREAIDEMADYLANIGIDMQIIKAFSKIGDREYPDVIAKKL
jgi:hypothetical protein